MIQLPLMAALFGLPIQPPPHVILRSVESVSETVIFETTTPDLLQDLASSQPPSGFGTLPQPIYPPPSGSGQGQGSTDPNVQQPSPPPKTPASKAGQPTENWADRIWQRYKGKGGSN
jgi:hypothetical protein